MDAGVVLLSMLVWCCCLVEMAAGVVLLFNVVNGAVWWRTVWFCFLKKLRREGGYFLARSGGLVHLLACSGGWNALHALLLSSLPLLSW